MWQPNYIVYAPFLCLYKFDRMTDSQVFPAKNKVPQHSLLLVGKVTKCEYKISMMNWRIKRKTRRKHFDWIKKTNIQVLPTLKEDHPVPFLYPKNWDCIRLNTTHFSKRFWFISPSFFYGEDLHICWTLIILFWIPLQIHLLIYSKWTFSLHLAISCLDPIPLIKRFFSFCFLTPPLSFLVK